MDKPPQYFEGTLQLRNPSQEILDFVANDIEKKKNVWIAKTEKSRNGIDLFLSSNRYLREIAMKLKGTFPGELVESNTLHTRSNFTSKDLYRGCYMFKFHDVKKGDIITFKGGEYEILQVAKDILAKNKETREKIHIKFSQL